MARYIDADALMKEFCDFVRPSNNSDFAPVPIWNDAVSLVGSAPTADVVERKVGKWRLNKDGNWACPFCEFDPYHDNMSGMNYCPNCGARLKMPLADCGAEMGEEDG